MQTSNSIWHPFSLKEKERPLITGAKGAYLHSIDGRRYLDATSSWFVNLHGHCHPFIIEKSAEAMKQIDQVLFADFTHEYALELTDKLITLAGPEFTKVFFSDSGSTAVETALKIALGANKKKKILSLEGGYYGDTFGSMSLAGENAFNRSCASHFFEVVQVSAANIEEHLENACCFIYEPLLQGAIAGMRLYPSQELEKMLSLCRQNEVISIADEVMTGFGRCGPTFASQTVATRPDILCVAKALTGGLLPIGATLVQEEIYAAFTEQPLLHGSSYAGNPITAAAALANLTLLERPECLRAREEIEKAHQAFCNKWKSNCSLKRLEFFGTMLILEYSTPHPEFYSDPIRERLNGYFFSEGIAIRPFGRVVYIAPPYCINKEELQWIYQTIESSPGF